MAVSGSNPGDIVLDAEAIEAVLGALVTQLDAYVFPEVAEKIQNDLEQRLEAGGYGDLTGGQQLADTLTAQLQQMSGDRNLRLHFSPAPLPHLEPDTAPDAAEIERQYQASRRRNFDFNKVERLPGNVGYIQLFSFEPPEFAGATLAAAMTLVAHTDALIFDLRHNQGGSPATVALLCSYLLPAHPPVHLNDLYWSETDETHQWWTVPYVPGQRYLDKPVFALTSPETFSAAEEFAYNLQVLKRGAVVGETTRGGANPGRGFRLHDHFWVFMPTGQAINPTTGRNWDGTGVVPTVKVPAETALDTAHLMALNHLLEAEPEGVARRELEETLPRVERSLQQKRQDLIANLGGPS
ncbi:MULTISPECIES: S41 family peptidase [Cyanophyceae]|uniref:S41 family peptidase n=1 Tax=Leptolyngbya subtilissima DQ-A4 TaxID=2933933 RepID=A0ABV0K632_9CYAN|nr:S41 family peptidase [Nodosilinea sp. FACHB-141]MBD2114506.1 S41 family peptidase [Nodosilinea sp. FACHB-141]